ncbi:MAG: glycosyltransferase [Opitutae bacterium]|nr:glycosyltransferase [Opitutae bacterium]
MNAPHTTSAVHLAHHWYVARRGGERVLEEMARLFPSAAISTLFLRRSALPPELASRDWQVSRLGALAPRWCDHRRLLPLYPSAVRAMRVPAGTRLLLSSDAALIKGLRKPPGCAHVCYCHTPPRYLWDLAEEYLRGTSGLGLAGRWVFRQLLPRLRAFDRAAAADVDVFVANSRFVAERIRRIYDREAGVVYPPVELARFRPMPPRDYYLVVAELVAYKRADLAVAACARSGRKLIVAGDGPEASRLRTLAGPTVQFLGRVSDPEVAELMAGCRALLHPQLEDFGIAALEAQAAGRPVIAYRGGGALETVREGETGVFFDAQTLPALEVALADFEARADSFAPEVCRRQAERFSAEAFRAGLSQVCGQIVPDLR